MKIFRQVFLFFVGTVSVAYEEIGKSVNEVNKTIEERRERLGGWSRRQA